MPAADDTPVASVTTLRPGTVRGTEGFYRVGQDESGRWWFIDPADRTFFLRAVGGVHAGSSPHGTGVTPPPAERLRAWGFNAAGVAAPADAGDLPFVGSVDLLASGRQIVGAGLRLPDVFDPDWAHRALERAHAVCFPLAGRSELIGWITDRDLDWSSVAAPGQPTLLQRCLSLEPDCPAYHAAWEFALALHRGKLDALAHAWGTPLANREVVRERTRAEQALATRGYLRDDARWTREFARRYFAGASAAIRAADPNHLVLGPRFHHAAGPHVLAECAYPAVDVAMPDWTELPAGTAAPTQPLIAGNVSWVTSEFLRPLPGGRTSRLTTVERMLQRARHALERLPRHPAVTGYCWAQWQDEPGEQPPFARGVIHTNGAEAREHLDLLVPFNARFAALPPA
jgi:agarase